MLEGGGRIAPADIARIEAAEKPGIRALNLGAIKVLTIDEVFGPAPTITE